MPVQADTVIFATDDSAAGIADARAWIKLQQLTADDARLIRKDGQCLVIAKKPLSGLRVTS